MSVPLHVELQSKLFNLPIQVKCETDLRLCECKCILLSATVNNHSLTISCANGLALVLFELNHNLTSFFFVVGRG